MASVASVLRTAIVDANLSNVTTKVFRDFAPDNISTPFVTFTDDVSRSPALIGDRTVLTQSRMTTVHLWQDLDSEDLALVDSLHAAVDNATLTGADKTIFGCRVDGIARLIDPPSNSCQHALTVTLTQGA